MDGRVALNLRYHFKAVDPPKEKLAAADYRLKPGSGTLNACATLHSVEGFALGGQAFQERRGEPVVAELVAILADAGEDGG
jgi:hypothetical protein